MFFAGLPMAGDGRQPFTGREEFLETSGDLYMSVRATLHRMEAEMDGHEGGRGSWAEEARGAPAHRA